MKLQPSPPPKKGYNIAANSFWKGGTTYYDCNILKPLSLFIQNLSRQRVQNIMAVIYCSSPSCFFYNSHLKGSSKYHGCKIINFLFFYCYWRWGTKYYDSELFYPPPIFIAIGWGLKILLRRRIEPPPPSSNSNPVGESSKQYGRDKVPPPSPSDFHCYQSGG